MITAPLAHDVTGSGPLVVLLHGITENRHSWDPIHLEDRYTVLRVDLRGHGRLPASRRTTWRAWTPTWARWSTRWGPAAPPRWSSGTRWAAW